MTNKLLIKAPINGKYINIRTACVIFVYDDVPPGFGRSGGQARPSAPRKLHKMHRDSTKVLMINEKHMKLRKTDLADINLGFPGGTVEKVDNSIEDTCARELWEEVFCDDLLENHGEEHLDYLASWRSQLAKIKKRTTKEHQLFMTLYNKIHKAKKMIHGSIFKTMYFVVRIAFNLAQRLIDEYNMKSVDYKILHAIYNIYQTRTKTGNIYFCSTVNSGQIMCLRSRDVCGMKKFVNLNIFDFY